MNNAHTIWFLGGPEIGEKHKEYDTIYKNIETFLQKDNKTSPNIQRNKFYIGDDNVENIAEEITNTSLFTPHKLIIIENADNLSAPHAKKIALSYQHVHDVNPQTTFMILFADTHKIHSSLDNLIPAKNKKIFWKLSESDYSRHITKKAMDLNIQLHPDAIDMIIHLAGENTEELNAILSSIAQHSKALHSQKPTLIEKESIENWVAHYKQESVFTLFSALSMHRYQETVDILTVLLMSQENLIHIIAGIIYQIKNSIRIKAHLLSGLSIQQVCKLLRIPGGYTIHNQYKNFIEYISLSSLEDIFSICEHTNVQLRSGHDAKFQKILVSNMMYQIIAIMQGKH